MNKTFFSLFLKVLLLSWAGNACCAVNGSGHSNSQRPEESSQLNLSIPNLTDSNIHNPSNIGIADSLVFLDNSASALKDILSSADPKIFSSLFQSSIADLNDRLVEDIQLYFNSGSISQQNISKNHKLRSPEINNNDFLFIPDPKNHTADNCYIVKVKSSASGEILKKLNQLFGAISAKIKKQYKHGFRGYHVCFPGNNLPLALLREIPSIEFVERDNIIKATQVQENAPWGLARLSNPDPRQKSFGFDGTGEGVTVYVLDSGVAKTKELGNRAVLGYSVYPNLPADCAGHGTQVSSLIAGTNVGVAKKASVVAAQVLDCLGDGKNSDLIDALSWVIETHQKPAIINMSLGGDRSPSIEKAVKAAISAGIPVIVSAGNSNIDACTQSPAAVAEAITVAASTQSNSRAKFSNFGPCVDIFAPGVDILAATSLLKSRNGWKFSSGTSFASPFVAGVSALILEKYPQMTPAELLETIKTLGAVGVMKSSDLNGSPNILVQAPPANTKLPILVKLAEAGYLPMQGYHTSSIVSAELVLVIVSFIIATLALFATGGALIRRRRRQKISQNSSITEEDLKHSVLNSQRPSVFLLTLASRLSQRKFSARNYNGQNFSNLNTFIYGTSAAIFFGGICYAAVPLYRIFCNATGFAGTPKTGHYALDPSKLDGSAKGREIKISFVANTARSMPWKFKPEMKYITVRPGQSSLAFYRAFNPTDQEIIGMSTYNIIPAKAAPYFNKIQCFCFEEQRLGPKEEVEMPVFFYIDPEFSLDSGMNSVDEIVLSYTFFDTSKPK